jgi:hypothetical protein
VDYWLDLGNNADSGQFILGKSKKPETSASVTNSLGALARSHTRRTGRRWLAELQRGEVLDRQEPSVNPTLANQAVALLARLFRCGTIAYHGGFVSLSSLVAVQALRFDPKYRQRLRRRR